MVRHALRRRHRHRASVAAATSSRISNGPQCTEANAGDVNQCYPIGVDAQRLRRLALSPQSLTPRTTTRTRRSPHRFADANKPSVLPIINLVVGVDFRLPQVRGWEAKIEGGFYNAFFLGGGVGYTF